MKELQKLMDSQKVWSDNTFNNGEFSHGRSLPISHHLQKESKELTEAIENYLDSPSDSTSKCVQEELADCFLLLLDCTAHIGFSVQSLMLLASEKHEINKKRQWGKPDANGVVEHIK